MKEMPDNQKHTKKSSMEQVKAGGSTGKRDNKLHGVLFMSKGLPNGEKLSYYVNGQKMLNGRKWNNRIICGCCSKEVSPSEFEAHAGMAARRQPYRHIKTSVGLTLHEIAESLSDDLNPASYSSERHCTICGVGGVMLLCGGCPHSYHKACLNLESSCDDGWRCQNCGEFLGAGPKEPSIMPAKFRKTRLVKAPKHKLGGCSVCRGADYSKDNFNDRTVLFCDQCDREFHVGCLRDSGLCDLKELPRDEWFCCDDCNKIHSDLQKSVQIPASMSNTISQEGVEKGLSIHEDVCWKILHKKSSPPENYQHLSMAAAIFQERFKPFAKSSTDLISYISYGEKTEEQEVSGADNLYCVVLIAKSSVVSAGLLRIFGRDVAELPLVATSIENQGKGYFQKLFSYIEGFLNSFNVKKLVLPAVEEAMSVWEKLGFTKMSDDEIYGQRQLKLTVFEGSVMLQKELQPAP